MATKFDDAPPRFDNDAWGPTGLTPTRRSRPIASAGPIKPAPLTRAAKGRLLVAGVRRRLTRTRWPLAVLLAVFALAILGGLALFSIGDAGTGVDTVEANSLAGVVDEAAVNAAPVDSNEQSSAVSAGESVAGGSTDGDPTTSAVPADSTTASVADSANPATSQTDPTQTDPRQTDPGQADPEPTDSTRADSTQPSSSGGERSTSSLVPSTERSATTIGSGTRVPTTIVAAPTPEQTQPPTTGVRRSTTQPSTTRTSVSLPSTAGPTTPSPPVSRPVTTRTPVTRPSSTQPTTATTRATTSTTRPATTTTRPATTAPPPTQPTLPSVPTTAPPSGGGLIWEDNFNSLDTSRWALEHSTYGDGNNELQCYRPENVSVSGGRLVLRAVTESYTCPNGSTRLVTSGMVRSRGVSFGPGQAIEFRVKLTPADEGSQGGLWPAVWSSGWAGGGWPNAGELDYLEVMTANNPRRSVFSMHYAKPDGSHGVTNRPVVGSENFSASWHTVRFEYGYGGQLAWYLDGNLVHQVSNVETAQGYPAPFDQATNEIKINLALGGRPGPLDPRAVGSRGATFEVDYIRVTRL